VRAVINFKLEFLIGEDINFRVQKVKNLLLLLLETDCSHHQVLESFHFFNDYLFANLDRFLRRLHDHNLIK